MVALLQVKSAQHDKHRGEGGSHGILPDLTQFNPLKTSPSLCALRPNGLEHGERPEVAAVDGAPVQAASRWEGLPGPDWEGPVQHERGGVPSALAAVRRHAARTPGYMEVRCVCIYVRACACVCVCVQIMI